MVGIVGVVGLFSMFGYAGLQIGEKGEGRLRQGPRRRPHLADPGPGDDQPLRRDGAGAADRRPAAVRLLREQQPARVPLRGRSDPQRRPRGDRRRWQTPRRRRRAHTRAWKESSPSSGRARKEWWWRPAERQDTSCRPWRSPPSFGIAAPRSPSSAPASGSRPSWCRRPATRSTSSRCAGSTAATR